MQCAQLMKREVHVVAEIVSRHSTRRVGAVMTRGAISCRPTQTVSHAERLIRRP